MSPPPPTLLSMTQPGDVATDQDRLAALVAIWWGAVDSFTRVLEHVADDQWSTPTDLPGWDVRAVASHVAHLERVLATGVEEQAEIGDPPPAHVAGLLGHYTEIGVVNRNTLVQRETRYQEQWRYDATAERWWITGGLPEFWKD